LAKSLQHSSRNTNVRKARTMITTADDINSWSDPIEVNQMEADRIVVLAEVEGNEVMVGSMADLQARQVQHDQTLHKSHLALQNLST
jgi:hypothetical protein